MYQSEQNEQITTALLLAAGTGHRLQPLTNNMPKCLTKVNEKEILAHLVHNLHQHNFRPSIWLLPGRLPSMAWASRM